MAVNPSSVFITGAWGFIRTQGIFSPVYIDNLVDGLVLAATSDAAVGQVFTLSDGVGVANDEFFGHYFAMHDKAVRTAPAGEVGAAFAAMEADDLAAGREPAINRETVDYFMRRGTYSIAKARRVLGYEPAVDLAEGMARTEAWLRAEGWITTAPTPDG